MAARSGKNTENRILTAVSQQNLIKATFGKGHLFKTQKKKGSPSIRENIQISLLQKEDGTGLNWNFRGQIKKKGNYYRVTGFVNTQTGNGHLEIEWEK